MGNPYTRKVTGKLLNLTPSFSSYFLRRTPAGRYGFVSYEPPDYMNILPEERKLVEVSSNIWGTKFKIVASMNNETLPMYLGHVSIRILTTLWAILN